MNSPADPCDDPDAACGQAATCLYGRKHSEATAPASTAFGSTRSGGFASVGATTGRVTLRSWTITEGCDVSAKNGMRPVHPGEILRQELDEIGLSANALSKALGVPVNRVTMILNGQRGVSADTALRLARYFGTTAQFWLNLQKTWELRRAEIETGREIAKQVTPRHAVV